MEVRQSQVMHECDVRTSPKCNTVYINYSTIAYALSKPGYPFSNVGDVHMEKAKAAQAGSTVPVNIFVGDRAVVRICVWCAEKEHGEEYT